MASVDLQNFRQEYSKGVLIEESLPEEPFPLLLQWLEEAVQAGISEPNAFTLATADSSGQPHARIVLLKEVVVPFLFFYTNYESAKGVEIAQNPKVSATFWWRELERQLRVEGTAQKASEEKSNTYFLSRPYGSQIGAWASPQSQPIKREELMSRWQLYMEKFAEGEVPRPPYWGGYQILPHYVEFWQGRPNRLHDRIIYRRRGTSWEKYRIAP
ncbi:MAG: pyridoxamine 5'-phosphate oxidase [Bacteroidia bacterium]|nr:pyridoxamine 5'-phosphate oxidase [Bacteroidia bacterium]MDW8134084.1 pyridoxamine 5'-phosphate oxidase [Bacteroidia bacterium]